MESQEGKRNTAEKEAGKKRSRGFRGEASVGTPGRNPAALEHRGLAYQVGHEREAGGSHRERVGISHHSNGWGGGADKSPCSQETFT